MSWENGGYKYLSMRDSDKDNRSALPVLIIFQAWEDINASLLLTNATKYANAGLISEYFQHLQKGSYLLNQSNCSFKIKTEINKFPLDAFFLVFFLFKNKHVMVEELLQLLVGQVDAKLFECIVLDIKRGEASLIEFQPNNLGKNILLLRSNPLRTIKHLC